MTLIFSAILHKTFVYNIMVKKKNIFKNFANYIRTVALINLCQHMGGAMTYCILNQRFIDEQSVGPGEAMCLICSTNIRY